MKSILEFIIESNQKEIRQKKEGISILDKIISKDDISKDEVKQQIENLAKIDGAFKPNGPVIYCFITDKVKDAIKIGYTDQHPEKRIEQWKEIYGQDEGEVQCLGYWSSEVVDKTGEKVFFWDHAVHKIVEKDPKYGYENLKKDRSTGTFFLDDLTERGKNKLKEIKLHYSKEFFRKFATFNPEKKSELNEVLLQKILEEMKQQILDKKADFTIYHFTEEGKQEGRKADIAWGAPQRYDNTDLQRDAIVTAIDMINGDNSYENNPKNHLLMAAVMRFGKTHAAYEIVNGKIIDGHGKKHKLKNPLKRIIVVSAKADVREAWREDINHKDFYKDFVFIEINDKYSWNISSFDKEQNSIVTKERNIGDPRAVENEYADKKIIYFFTLQDLSGNLKKTKAKHEHIFENKFDMMIVDETHYGSHAKTYGQIAGFREEEIEDTDIEDAKRELEESEKLTEEIQSKLKLSYDISLQVSGTPYYILASNEMLDPSAGIITKVSFTDMLNARDKWNRENAAKDPDDPNPETRRKEDWESPYFGIPNLRKIGLSLTDECKQILENEGYTSSMTTLFKTNEQEKFVYEDAIRHLMKAIFGDGKGNTLAFMKTKSIEGNKICKHTIVVLPRIKACAAMENILNEMLKDGDRDILNLTNGTIKDVKELNEILKDIERKNRKSIILTVNRMLTGTSIPLVDSMIYMKNASSPQEYDQNIFRLCTRNVKKVHATETDENGNKKEVKKMVNMKDNVYLIDFNIDNTLQMMANSAKMKAMADIHDGSKEPITDLIEKYMKEDARAIPLWGEGANDNILGKMEQIMPDDLMRVYTKYNQNKSINEIVNSEVDAFKGLFLDVNFQDAIRDIDVPDDNGKNIIVPPAKQNLQDIPIDKKYKKLPEYIKADAQRKKEYDEAYKEAQAIAEAARRKFIGLSKKILYLNICLDEPYDDFDKLLKDVGHDKVLDELIENFEIDINDVKKVYNTMKPGFKAGFNAIFTRIKLFFEKGDKSLKPIDKFNKSVEGLGKVAKNEVITPDEIVDKMIAKLDDDEYLNAESILLVNEKKGEFLQGLIRKFKPEIAKKCKIIPSSMIGKQLTSKMLKTQNLNDYINDIIIDLEDYDKSGKIDVKDFLKMTNEEVLKKNDGRRFDVCLMNPPYNAPGDSKSGEGSIESEFINKLNKICNYVIAVYPFSRWQKREKISKENSTGGHLEEIDIYDIHNYFDVATQWKHLGIWKYNNVKEFENTQIHDFIKDKEYNVETKDNLDNIKKVYSEITNELISVKPIIEKYKKLYDDLVSKYKTMVNDGHGFIYEENRFKGASRFGINRKNKIQRDLERVRKYLKEGRYKYCLYHGSYNGPLFKEWKGEDPDKLFKGQLCWLTNSKTVQNNILYWTQSVLFNLWSAYYIGSRGCNDGMFGYVPALDFEMNENDFKEYVDSLNDFTDEEIKILKDNKIYNADKL